jgi:hypothetical protein
MLRAILPAVVLITTSATLLADDWARDPVWHDGLVEKATYSASRTIYGKPRHFDAVFFTNKEQHDVQTQTKASQSDQTIEVWKFNQVEVVPTPNYEYKFVTTSHHTVQNLILTRLDFSSQEFCGTSFKQYAARLDPRSDSRSWDYFSFSYMPEAGRTTAVVRDRGDPGLVPFNSLPLWLRNFDFARRTPVKFLMLPDQKSNRPTPHEPVEAEIRPAGDEGGSHKLELHAAGKLIGTFWMATDRLHVMTKYQGADGQTYELRKVERVDYWTIKGE